LLPLAPEPCNCSNTICDWNDPNRQATSVQLANPHPFRHTFAPDMIRAGMSLPALMELMGHTNIQTTLLYLAADET
jgi:site-specific recombinase XerD